MTRMLTAFGLMLTAAASIGLYQVKYQVQDMERNLAAMKRQIVHDHAEMQVLDAEWSFLNQPERLQDLSRRYLALAPIRSSQMASIESLPPRAAPVLAAVPVPGSTPPSGNSPTLAPLPAPPVPRAPPAAPPNAQLPMVPPPAVRPQSPGFNAPAGQALMISSGTATAEDITPVPMGDDE